MHMQAQLLASGPGWQVHDIACFAGPNDRPFQEMHRGINIAAVIGGTFQYRTMQGSAVLAPGALLLGNDRACYQCGHEHGTGDRCVSFHFEPALFESIVSDLPGARRTEFAAPSLPPLAASTGLLASIESASEAGELEELALRVAATAVAASSDSPRCAPPASRRDERRISDALRHIEAMAHERLSLAGLARAAGLSRYHFLRTFRRVVGMTPHQFVLRTRLQRAALRIRRSKEQISTIAFDAGFDDLSTFNRRFRQLMGQTPGAFRARDHRG